ncbi:MAG: ABC transporter permease [Microbacteriaceae bacterium]|nr:ABC transporter permease [Microbacteriaceae bacterium]
MANTPSAVRRVGRDRPRLVAVALLALVSLAAAGINATAAERLQSLLDANWRGAYDILVTANGNQGDLAGLLAPNTLSSGSNALTLDDLAKIREVPDVEVAAPIGEVIVSGLSTGPSHITLPKGFAGANQVPQSFRVTLTYWTDDGLGKRLVAQQVYPLVIDETDKSTPPADHSGPCTLNGFVVDERYPTLYESCGNPIPTLSDSLYFYPTGNGWSSSDDIEGDSIIINLGTPPLSATRITLVDPVAEKALLGKAGDFLDPLIQIHPNADTLVDQMNDWANQSGNAFAENFLTAEEERETARLGIDNSEWFKEFKQLYADNGEDFPENEAPTQNYTPLLVRDAGTAPLTMEVSVEGFGPVKPDKDRGFGYLLPNSLTAGEAGVPLGQTEGDISALLNPFVLKTISVPWPGTMKVDLSDVTKYRSAGIYYVGTTRGVRYALVSSTSDNIEVEQTTVGFRSPIPNYSSDSPGQTNLLRMEDQGTDVGMESVYTDATAISKPANEGGPIAVPVGAFSLDEIAALQSDLSFVPLGAYQSVGSTLIPGSSAHATGAVKMGPSLNGVGLVSPETIAIASIDSAAAWHQDAPVSAVRVRVSGVDKYSPEAVANITKVAQAIRALGFSATIVAGSSPTDVTVDVDGYAFGVTDLSATQEVGRLGSVTQRWSELGAAARVDLAVSNTSFAILAVALGAAALLLAAVQLAGVPGRRAQASVLRTIGWRRRRIVRWLAAEELVSLGIIMVAGIIALFLASSRSAVTIAVAGSVAALVVTSTLAVVLGARPLPSGIRPLKRGRRRHKLAEVRARISSIWQLAMRQVFVHRLNAFVQVLASIVVAIAAATVTVTLMEGRAAAGASALGVFAVDQAFIAQLALGGVALLAGIVLAVIARRIDLGRRREQWSTMRAMGWGAGQVRAVQLIEGMLVGLPAVVIAAALSWWYLHELAAVLMNIALPIAVGTAVLLTVILVLTSWREKK